MMQSEYFINENANAEVIEADCFPGPGIPMFRYEAIADYCSNDVALIHVTKTEGTDTIFCEPIFYCMIDKPNETMKSYAIYANEREDFGQKTCFVVRKVCWNKKKEMEKLQQYPERRQEFLKDFPMLTASNVVIFGCEDIIHLLHDVDGLTGNGIILSERGTAEWPAWADVQIKRRYDWGEISYGWGAAMKNEKIEQQIMKAEEVISSLESSETVFRIALDYRAYFSG